MDVRSFLSPDRRGLDSEHMELRHGELFLFPLRCSAVSSYSSSLNKIIAHTLVVFLENGALYTNVKYKPSKKDYEK